jgi:hypothetical protein
MVDPREMILQLASIRIPHLTPDTVIGSSRLTFLFSLRFFRLGNFGFGTFVFFDSRTLAQISGGMKMHLPSFPKDNKKDDLLINTKKLDVISLVQTKSDNKNRILTKTGDFH